MIGNLCTIIGFFSLVIVAGLNSLLDIDKSRLFEVSSLFKSNVHSLSISNKQLIKLALYN